MKIFMTGATGFIGSHIAMQLLKRGDTLVCYARNPQKVPELWENKSITWVQGELSEIGKHKAMLVDCQACIHVALGWGDTPTEMLLNDTLPAVQLLELAHQTGVESFIYTSSTAAMGQMRNLMNESLRCIPVDLYGATKAAVEGFVLGFNQSALRRNIVRPGYTFGKPVTQGAFSQPDQRFNEIVKKALHNQNIELIKYDGTQFIAAQDLAKLYISILDNAQIKNEVFLGLASQWKSWESVAQQVIEFTQSKSKIVLQDLGWGSEPMIFEVKKAEALLQTPIDSNDALTEYLQYLIALYK